MRRISFIKLSFLVLCIGFGGGLAQAQSVITYQGKLNDGGAAANGTYDFTFKLFSVASGGTQIGADVVRDDVQVANGVFTVNLDFGASPFTSVTGNYLEISVRAGASTGAYTLLNPRLPVTNSPYAIKSLNAENATTATNALSLGGVAANQFVLTGDPRLSDDRNPLPNSANYIQNTTTQQLSSNFNIQGNGTLGGTLSANVVNSATQYNIDGFRILSAPTGTANLYAGFAAGNNPGTGTRNSAFGYFAGELTNSGGDNSFFGHFAGRFTVGSGNSFFGSSAGLNNAGGDNNTFFGISAGLANTVGSNNTIIGANANVGANNLSFATAIGAGSVVSSNNTLVLGRNLDTVQIPGSLNVAGTFTGTVSNATTANNALNLGGVAANQYLTTTTANASFIQNSTTQQASSNFNISGNGTLGGTLAANSLFVYPTSGNGSLIFRNRANTNFSQVVFSDEANIYRGYMGYIGANGGLGTRNDTFEIGTNGKDLTFRPSEIEVMRFKTSGRIGIGTNNPAFKLELIDSSNTGLRVQTNTAGGTVASFGGAGEFLVDASGVPGGRFRIAENGNVGIGGSVFSDSKLTVSGTGIVRSTVNSDSNAGFKLSLSNSARWSVATVTGGNFQIFNDFTGQNAFWINSATNNIGIGTTTPTFKLEVNQPDFNGLRVQIGAAGGKVASFGSVGEFQIDSLSGVVGGRLTVKENGNVRINNPPGIGTPITGNTEMLTVNGFIRAFMPPLGIGIPVCQEAATSSLVLCAVSSRRYKQDIQNFDQGLNVISRLRSVSFNWRVNGQKDFGLIAEEVAEVDPLLTYTNASGETEGVKYDRLSVILVNAVKEQQTQIEAQQKQIVEQNDLIKAQAEKLEFQQTEFERQKSELEALKKLVCSTNPAADICQPKNQL